MTLSVDEFIAFAGSLEGETLCTLTTHKPFTVSVVRNTLLFTPLGSQNERREGRKSIERVLRRYDDQASLHPGDYHDLTYNASYILSILYLMDQPKALPVS